MTGQPLVMPFDELRMTFEIAITHVEAVASAQSATLDHDHSGRFRLMSCTTSTAPLRDLLADEDRAVGYHLVRLADVLRAIGQTVPERPLCR
ncbi:MULTISPECIES: hypothetical protein [unclassified Nocardia]|uniref:hypothetical protein n=1 Tax=unclassified Nocardia TaxID=2637762 RepID=UPI00278C8B3F|nr:MULTISPECIES: hypothetical protein [unclassified Nocardia]